MAKLLGKKTKRLGGEAQIIDRAVKNPEFRAALLANPKQAVAEEFGVDLSKDLELLVVEETASRSYIVLPPADEDAEDDGDLTDDDLKTATQEAVCINFVSHRNRRG